MDNAPIRILFIDDDEGLCRLVKKDLQRHGFNVELAQTGAAGLQRLKSGSVDAVVLDHHLPDCEGLSVLKDIQKMPEAPPVIYLTGMQDSRMAVAALKAGAADYVTKDVQGEFLALLRADIQSGIASQKLRRAKEAAEEQMRAAHDRYKALADERALLLREMNHRVSNSLQLIASLLQFQSRKSSPEIQDALMEAYNRVLAVAKVHRSLYVSENVQSVELHLYLEALTKDIRSISAKENDCSEISLKVDPIEIEPDKAVAVGVIITELILNARKHAYPTGYGPIRVNLSAIDVSNSVLTVEDDGVGMAGDLETGSSGLGTVIINAMAQKLDANIQYDVNHKGTRAIVTFDPTMRVTRHPV